MESSESLTGGEVALSVLAMMLILGVLAIVLWWLFSLRKPRPVVALDHERLSGRLRRGWRLARGVWRLLGRDRRLLILPAVPVAAGLTALGLTGWIVGAFPWEGEAGTKLAYFAAALVIAYPMSLVTAFSGVAFTIMARDLLDGASPSFRSALAAAWRRRTAIAWWALLAAGVAVLLQSLEQIRGGGLAARLASWMLGIAWSLVTFLAIPVLTLERRGVRATVGRSASLFKERWGEQVGARTYLFGVFVVACIPPSLLISLACSALADTPGSVPGLVLLLVGLALMSVAGMLFSALEWLLALILYRFATEQRVADGFTASDLDRPFGPRRRLFG